MTTEAGLAGLGSALELAQSETRYESKKPNRKSELAVSPVLAGAALRASVSRTGD